MRQRSHPRDKSFTRLTNYETKVYSGNIGFIHYNRRVSPMNQLRQKTLPIGDIMSPSLQEMALFYDSRASFLASQKHHYIRDRCLVLSYQRSHSSGDKSLTFHETDVSVLLPSQIMSSRSFYERYHSLQDLVQYETDLVQHRTNFSLNTKQSFHSV